ncbi:unnamed protein product [Coffea canephora]|uniref:Protein LURP-one-related 8 n=1 Tax=Coffea canephora TaxID=49390 RepID=A0A068TQM5_COFCA|nr:unnamed protein product [Coffea canephora]
MTRVFPNATSFKEVDQPNQPLAIDHGGNLDGGPVVLTVWKKSLLFNCDGFTVFDAEGNLVFRVDNYMSGAKGEIVLMDASGKSLLTIRRKRLSIADNWLVFAGEEAVNPRFSVRKQVNFLNSRSLAQVSCLSCCDSGSPSSPCSSSSPKKKLVYEIEGSYKQRCCAVYDDKRRRVAEIKRKEAVGGLVFGLDVFRLIVLHEPGSRIESAVAMALVIVLEQMFGSSSYSPRALH